MFFEPNIKSLISLLKFNIMNKVSEGKTKCIREQVSFFILPQSFISLKALFQMSNMATHTAECCFWCWYHNAILWQPELKPEYFPASLQEAEVTQTQEAQPRPNMPLVTALGCFFLWGLFCIVWQSLKFVLDYSTKQYFQFAFSESKL